MARAEDLGRYFRIPPDSRDLNYGKYFVEGELAISQAEDYTSHNTKRLDVDGVKLLLQTIDMVKDAMSEGVTRA
jgi:UDP-glucose 4-epimerase